MLDGRVSAPEPESSRLPDTLPAAISDIGCERDIQEDRYAMIDSPAGRAWIVCDGMGGSLGGDLAAQLAIDAIQRALHGRRHANLNEAIKTAVEEANRIIVLRRQNPAFSAMGTTVVATIMQDGELVIGNAGDSRAYLIRAGSIEQLTTDHTYVQELVEHGTITEEEALSHPHAHVLTRCLGADPRLAVDLHPYWIWDTPAGESDDKLLLCSDGLYSLVSDEEILQVVSDSPPSTACIKLVEMAKERGGFDNITVVVLPVGGQLREETPATPRVVKRKSGSGPRMVMPESREDLIRQVFLSVMLTVIGVLGICGVLFLQLGRSLK